MDPVFETTPCDTATTLTRAKNRRHTVLQTAQSLLELVREKKKVLATLPTDYVT